MQNLQSFLYFSSQIQICTSILRNDASLVQKGSSVKRASAELSAVSAVCVALNLPSNFHPLPFSSIDWISKLHSLRKLNTLSSPYLSCGLKRRILAAEMKKPRKVWPPKRRWLPSLPQWVNSCDVVPPVPFTGQWLIQLIQFSVDKLMNIPDHISVNSSRSATRPCPS